MKRVLVLLFTGMMLLGFAGLACATFQPCGDNGLECGPGEVFDSFTNDDSYWFSGAGQSHSWEFDISPPLQAGDTVMDTMLTVHFYDKGFWQMAKADVNTEDGDFWKGYIAYGADITGEVTAELQDFMLMVTVNSLPGILDCNFGVNGMTLDVCYKPVPEPGTLLLLGSGLAGLFIYRRRKMAS